MAKKMDKKNSIKKSSPKRKVTAVMKTASKTKAAPKKEIIKPKTESKNKLKAVTSKEKNSEKDLFQDLTADSVFSFDAQETPKKAVLLAASDNLDDFDSEKEPVDGAEELDLVDEEADLGYDDEYDYDYEEDDDLGDDEELDEELDDEEYDGDYDDEEDDDEEKEKEEEDYKY